MNASAWAFLVHGMTLIVMAVLAWIDVSRVNALRRGDWARSLGDAAPPFAPGDAPSTPLATLLAELDAALRSATSGSARVAALNEATSDFEGLLRIVHGGAVGWRVCCASGVAWACLLMARDPATAMGCAGSGAVVGMLTWRLGRMADSRTSELRARWNGLIRRLSRSFPQSETGSAA